jgi:hypothetical protein
METVKGKAKVFKRKYGKSKKGKKRAKRRKKMLSDSQMPMYINLFKYIPELYGGMFQRYATRILNIMYVSRFCQEEISKLKNQPI